MIFNMTGGGGASLNFKVVAYATEAALLAATPAENTIGVITTTAITSWIFSSEEPTSPTAGMVWFTTGKTSPGAFNALKKNGVMVYPLSAKQYIDGDCVDVPAMSYQNGAWVEWWTGQLYENGNEWESITGGWTYTSMGYAADASAAGDATITRDGNSMTFKMSSTAGAVVHPANKIDLTDYDTLVFDGIVTGATSYSSLCNLRVWSEFGTYSTENVAASKTIQSNVDGEVTLDISALSGEYYIGFGLWTDWPVVTMRSMRLE